MARPDTHGRMIQDFILNHMEDHPADIVAVTAAKFGISRQAVNKHVKKLDAAGVLDVAGNTRAKRYRLRVLDRRDSFYFLSDKIGEDVIWRRDIEPWLQDLSDNVQGLWRYAFTEMFNNVIDHSGGTRASVLLERTAARTTITVLDDGVGIFKKIQSELGLQDEHHALLELSKGKLTTDRKNHSGQGIFFTSRMMDSFSIVSGGISFLRDPRFRNDWILDNDKRETGTYVAMRLSNLATRTSKEVFDAFWSDGVDDVSGFSKTIIPIRLAQYENDELVSRSQAKRVLARVDQFKKVVFDFEGVETVGQAFADEIFRVFAREHPDIELLDANANPDVSRMIRGARAEAL